MVRLIDTYKNEGMTRKDNAKATSKQSGDRNLTREIEYLLRRVAELEARESRRKDDEVSLRKSEGRLRALVEHLPITIYLKDLDSRFQIISKQMDSWFGIRENVLGKRCSEIRPGEAETQWETQDAEIRESRATRNWEVTEQRLDGEPIHNLYLKFPVFDYDGALIGTGGAEIDITNRKQAERALHEAYDRLESRVEERTRELTEANTRMREEITERQQAVSALRKNEERYREIFDDSPIGIWEEDWSDTKAMLDGLARHGVKDWHKYFARRRDKVMEAYDLCRVVAVNRMAIENYGAPDAETLIADMAAKELSESALDGFCDTILACLADEATFEYEATDVKYDGSTLVIRCSVVILPEHSDDWSRIILNVEDITERKRIEVALSESEARLAGAQRIAQIGNWDWDVTSDTMLWSDETYRICGLEPDEVAADIRVFTDIVHPDDRDWVAWHFDEAREQGGSYGLVFESCAPTVQSAMSTKTA